MDQGLFDEFKRYKEAHKVASDSNSKLHQAMQVHLSNLKTLTKPLSELQGDIPSTADLDTEAEASIGKILTNIIYEFSNLTIYFILSAEFQRIIGKVNEMKQQRSRFMDELRENMLSDDITKKLVLHKNKEMPEIFTSELTKHENEIKILEQNLKAQDNIIRYLLILVIADF